MGARGTRATQSTTAIAKADAAALKNAKARVLRASPWTGVLAHSDANTGGLKMKIFVGCLRKVLAHRISDRVANRDDARHNLFSSQNML